MADHRPYAHVLPAQQPAAGRARTQVVNVALIAVAVAVAVPLVLLVFGADGWAWRWLIVTGLASGATAYHVGLLTVIALNADR